MSKAVAESEASAHAGGPDPLVGKVLDGRFRVVERLGAGGMGTVYKAVQAPLERIVALKVLNPNYDSKRDPGFHKRFFLEASVTSKLKHPNTITVIDYGQTTDGIYYLAMEFVEGITLAQVLLNEGTLAWQRTIHIAQQICRSLREAHRTGIIHRDLKPANVMVCDEGDDGDLVKVLDFGLVKTFGADGMALEGAELTQAGVFLGSPQYMAPEQARNTADPRSDIYSLGVVMFQMLTGKPPFYAEQSIDVIVKHMKEAPPSMRTVRPGLELPVELEEVVMRCLEKDPAQRFQSMDDVLDALRFAGTSAGLSGVFGPGSRNIGMTPPPMGPLSSTGAYRAGLTPTPSGMQRLPQSGAHARGGSGARTGAGVRPPTGPGSGPSSVALEISVETSQPSSVMSAARPIPRSRKALPFVIFGASALVGLAVVFALTRGGEPPAPAPAPAPPERAVVTPAAPPPAPKPPPPVRFRISSEPAGAQVLLAGKAAGITPIVLELPRGDDGVASAELTFRLDGYQEETVRAAGSGPEVQVSQRLERVAVAPPPRPRPQRKPKVTGYKDDPY